MSNSSVEIVELPEEILLYILNKLHNLDVLYSLLGSNRKLDRIAADRRFTQSIDLTKIFSNEKDNSKTKEIFDRFCSKILPRIHHHIQYLTIETCWLERILYANKFNNLHRLNLVNLDIDTAFEIFNDRSSLIVNFKDQICELIITIDYETADSFNLLVDIYRQIFHSFSKLKNIYLHLNTTCLLSKSLLDDDLSSTICSSSTITHLNIKLHNIDDCFLLLDGRLSQLNTLRVKLDYIHDQALIRRILLETTNHSFKLLNKTVKILLKHFSLLIEHFTSEFDSLLVPFLRRMLHLETLSLSIRLYQRTSFVDCVYLENTFLKDMFCSQSFTFDTVVDHVRVNEDIKPSFDDIRRTFIQGGYHFDGYLDSVSHFLHSSNQCHVYSVPFAFDDMQPITNAFPGGLFDKVTGLWLKDLHYSFEHTFFMKISQSFPLLRRLLCYKFN